MTEPVGFVGVGRMGAPMVRRLLARGYELFIRDVNDAAVAPFKGQKNVTVCDSPREVASRAPVVLLSLPLPRVLDEVVLGPDGIAEAGSGRVVIDLSTSGVAAARRVSTAARARGLRYLDAPVSGGVPGAEKGTLSVMVAGDRDLHDRYQPLLTIIGKNVFYIGAEPGQGQAMKLANNMLSGTALAATAEALAVTTKAGIPPRLALDVINVSSGRNSATQDKFPQSVITGRFDYGFLVKLLLKDVKLFEELAEELGVSTVVAEATVNAWRMAVAQGYGDQDITAIARMYERWAGTEIRDKS
jgi:3-hydroxyisobutyrate dehydrogenase-like beta-hydroxyacid dehydrogenase